MDIPLHPAVLTEVRRGQQFLTRVARAQSLIEGTRVTVLCPDGVKTVVFGGDAMVVEATFADDVFDRYPGNELGDLLTALCEEGFVRVSQSACDAVAEALDDEGLR